MSQLRSGKTGIIFSHSNFVEHPYYYIKHGVCLSVCLSVPGSRVKGHRSDVRGQRPKVEGQQSQSNIIGISWDVLECSRICQNVLEFSRTLFEVIYDLVKCQSSESNITRTSWNVLECARISQNVLECSRILWSALQCCRTF